MAKTKHQLYIVHSSSGIHGVTFDKNLARKIKNQGDDFPEFNRDFKFIHTETIVVDCDIPKTIKN